MTFNKPTEWGLTMPNTREKLIEILGSLQDYGIKRTPGLALPSLPSNEIIADHLLASSFIEELQNEAYDVGAQSVLHMRYGLTWKEAREAWLAAGKWIPVSERLPKKNEMVLVYCKDKTIRGLDVRHIGSCDNGFWFLKTQPGTESFPHPEWEVTHWMPLPEPPKEV